MTLSAVIDECGLKAWFNAGDFTFVNVRFFLFLLVIFLSPLAGMVPPYAAAGALIYVGVLMTSSLSRVKWEDLTEAVPAFVTAVMMPFSFSITEGIALGFISYCVMKVGTGRFRELSPCVIVVALLFVLKIVFIDAH